MPPLKGLLSKGWVVSIKISSLRDFGTEPSLTVGLLLAFLGAAGIFND